MTCASSAVKRTAYSSGMPAMKMHRGCSEFSSCRKRLSSPARHESAPCRHSHTASHRTT
jgi:hypothetical protein